MRNVLTYGNGNTILVKVEDNGKIYTFVLPMNYKEGHDFLEKTLDKMAQLNLFSNYVHDNYILNRANAIELLERCYTYDLTNCNYDEFTLAYMLDRKRDLSDLTDDELEDLGLGKCADCGEIYEREEMREVYDGDLICEGCLDSNFVWCVDIDDYVHKDYAKLALGYDEEEEYYYDTYNDLIWSEMQETYIVNEYAVRVYTDASLGDYDYVHKDYAIDNCYWSDIADEYFADCDDRDNYDYENSYHDDDNDEMPCDWLSDYSNHCNYYFNLENNRINTLQTNYIEDRVKLKQFDYVGCELEVEPSDDSNEYNTFDEIRDLTYNNGNRLIMLKRDGSLCDYGVEIVTNPMTFEAFENCSNIWNDMLGILIDNGYTSHDNGDCGLHFHISRTLFGKTEEEQDDNIKKMIKFYNLNYDNIVTFSRRTRSQCDSWCMRYTDISTSEEFQETFKHYNKVGHDSRRYMAVNITNEHTVEIRIMRGTLNEQTFWASYDFIKTIAKNSKEITWEQVNANDLTKWFVGLEEDTKEYARGRNAFNSVFSY